MGYLFLVKVDVPSCFVGLVLENCQLPFENHGHVILADPSPLLFYPISSTEVRCLVDVPGQKVPSISNGEMVKYLKTVVAPQVKDFKSIIFNCCGCHDSVHLVLSHQTHPVFHYPFELLISIKFLTLLLKVPPQLNEAFLNAVERGNIRTMPNRSMPAAPHPTPGALLMGDAFNMRHPLTGGGMTVALSDIVVLRDLLKPLRDLSDAPTLCKYLESFYTLRKVEIAPSGGFIMFLW